MNNLSIDIGNTTKKIAVFFQKELVHYQKKNEITVDDLIQLVEEFNIQKSIISSVDEDIAPFESYLKDKTEYIRFSSMLTNGVKNKYKTPLTLGLDRWAAVLGAYGLFPKTNCLIIDAGTCITYDVIRQDQNYFGGSISPGINMRFNAVHHFTKKLPLVKWNAENEIPEGTDTETAITNGVLLGIINEIEGFIALNNKKQTALKVILTGGDADFLFKQLQNSIFAPQMTNDSYLVLKGLNEAIAD